MSRGLRSAVPATLLAVAAVWAAPGLARALTLEPPVVRTLENGLRVAVFPVHRLPIAEIQLLVPAGSGDEGEGQGGLANLTALALKQGTSTRDALSLARALESLGATLTPLAGRDYTLVSGSFLAGDLDRGLQILADVVLRPSFVPDGLERLKQQAIGTALQSAANPASAADDLLWPATLGAHPYAQPPGGVPETIAALGAQEVRAFYRDHYRPDRSVLAVAGDVDPERVFALARDFLGPWSGRAVAPRTASPPGTTGARVRILDRPGSAVAVIRIGVAAPARRTEDAVALTLANAAFGAAPGSRLARAATRSVTEAHSTLTSLRMAGLFSVAAEVPADSAGAAATRLLGQVRDFAAHPPSQEELAIARRFLADVYPLPFESLIGLTSQWLTTAFYGLPADFLSSYVSRLAAVTPEEVAAALRGWLDPSRLVVVVAGPAASLRPQLEPLGPIEVVGAAEPGMTELASTPEQERRGRELLEQALSAHGGRDKLAGITSSQVDADVELTTGTTTLRGVMTQIRQSPSRFVMITEIQGLETRQVLDGDEGWTILGGDTATSQMADSVTVAGLRSGLESDIPHLLLAASRSGAKLAWRGRDNGADGDVDVVELAVPGEPRRRFLLDAATHRLLVLEEPGRSGLGFGARRIYGDYRAVEGVMLPHTEVRVVDGTRVMSVTVRDMTLNGPVDAAYFAKPRKLQTPR